MVAVALLTCCAVYFCELLFYFVAAFTHSNCLLHCVNKQEEMEKERRRKEEEERRLREEEQMKKQYVLRFDSLNISHLALHCYSFTEDVIFTCSTELISQSISKKADFQSRSDRE